jgi:hypothetical protein
MMTDEAKRPSEEMSVDSNPDLMLNVGIRDEDTGLVVSFRFHHTNHSYVRAAQRGIDRLRLQTTLTYGEMFFRQGLIFCILGRQNVPDHLSGQRDKLENTIVVLSAETDTIITCYRCKEPYKHVKMKQKHLSKRSMAA